jgi:hypothetical protein
MSGKTELAAKREINRGSNSAVVSTSEIAVS